VAPAVRYPIVSIASVTSPTAASGIAVAAFSRTSSRAPGISRALASLLPPGKNRSRRPWTTSVGTAISGRRSRQRGLQSSAGGETLAERVGPGEHRRRASEEDEWRVLVTERFDAQVDLIGIDSGHRITGRRRRSGSSSKGLTPQAPIG
jgi:hypothetical protein